AANISTVNLSLGTHIITATYSGDPRHMPSSGSITETVTTGKASIIISYSPSSVLTGEPVNFTIGLSNSAATGTITLSDGARAIGSGNIVNGQANVSTSFELGGNHTITANYSGDSDFASAVSSITVPVTISVPAVIGLKLTNPTHEAEPDGTILAKVD